jgi:hypothetical protein
VPAFSVVEDFNVFEDDPLGLFDRFVVFVMQQFLLEGGEEGLDRRLSQQFAFRLIELVMPWAER